MGINKISNFLVASLSILAISSSDKPCSDSGSWTCRCRSTSPPSAFSLYDSSRWSFCVLSKLVRDIVSYRFQYDEKKSGNPDIWGHLIPLHRARDHSYSPNNSKPAIYLVRFLGSSQSRGVTSTDHPTTDGPGLHGEWLDVRGYPEEKMDTGAFLDYDSSTSQEFR